MTWTDTALASVIVAAISAIGGVIIAIVSRKSGRIEEKEATVCAPIPENIAIKPDKIFARSGIEQQKIRPPLSDIEHRTMDEHIMRVPPAQRDSIEDHYIGLRVRWLVYLKSVSKIGEDFIMIHANLEPSRVALEGHAKPEDIACLLHLPENGIFILEGTLKLVSGAYCILEDCITDLPGKNETIPPSGLARREC